MSLPVGALITSIGGKRCTAIPRTVVAFNALSNSSAAPAADISTSITTAAPATPTTVKLSTAAALSELPTSNTAVAAAAVDPAISQSSSTSVAVPTSAQPTAPALSTSTPDNTQTTVPTVVSTVDPVFAASPTTSLAATTIIPTISSESSANASSAVAQSYSSITSTPSQSVQPSQAMASTIGFNTPTQAGESPAQSSATTTTSMPSNSTTNVGSVMGGVVGGLALAGILLFLCWRYIRRKNSRNSLLTPLNTDFRSRYGREKYEFDEDSLGPTPLGKRWKAQVGGFCSRMRIVLINFGSSVKGKFGRNSGAPRIDMNRGNSQFLEPILQHSRSNSTVSGGREGTLTTKDRLGDWWQRFIEDIHFNWRLRQKADEPINQFSATHSMGESHIKHISRDFSQFLVVKDHGLRQASERHHRSQSTATLLQLGSLGFEFGSQSNIFGDPCATTHPTEPNISKPPAILTLNPFVDSQEATQSTTSRLNASNYVSNVRRSRGLSQPSSKNLAQGPHLSSYNVTPITTPRYPSTAVASTPVSRYPSTIRTSQNSYRDTVLSALSISGRRDKGRSDPFDLDRPELRLPPPMPLHSQAETKRNSKPARVNAKGVNQEVVQPRIDSVCVGKPRIVSNTETYYTETYSSSIYSSGASLLFSEWGDPGPDLGPAALKRAGLEEGIIGSNGSPRGSVSSGSAMIAVGRAL